MPRQLSDPDYRLARPVWAEVSLDAITRNLAAIRRLAGRPVKVIATVKANAYGHGAAVVGLHLQALGVDALATANLDDALEMRRAGVTARIVMFASNLPGGVQTLLDYNLTPTVQDLQTAAAISRTATAPVNVHVKVDAGLGRLGVKLSDVRGFVTRLAWMPNIRVEGLYTHLPFSSATGAGGSRQNLLAFTSVVAALEREDGMSIDYTQAAASSILASHLPDSLNTVAPGHLLFGLSPLSDRTPADFDLTPALRTVKARLLHVTTHTAAHGASHHARGDSASSAAYATAHSQRTGVILLGLDNGYRMPATGDAWVLCRGRRCRVLSVTLEYTVIDLSAVTEAVVGDEVTVMGRDGSEELSIGEVATYLGLSPLLATLSFRRIPISYSQSVATPSLGHS